jgi:hypothetical protein
MNRKMININEMDNRSQLLLIMYGMAAYKYGVRLADITSVASVISTDCTEIGLDVTPRDALILLREAREFYEYVTK